jgi:1,4-dihydroxy-2-naphthoyl-CoA synthase
MRGSIMEDIVLYKKNGDIGKITLNKPEERNAITLNPKTKISKKKEFLRFKH